MKRKMHTHKQRRGMKRVQWLLFRFRHMHCCIGVRKTTVYFFSLYLEGIYGNLFWNSTHTICALEELWVAAYTGPEEVTSALSKIKDK